MNDRPESAAPELKDATVAIRAAREAYDSTVTIFSNGKKAEELPAHGQILVSWDKDIDTKSANGQLWLTKPDKSLVMVETGDNLTFQIDTPTGKAPIGERRYLEFFGKDGEVMGKSVAVGTILNEQGHEKHNEMIWTDEHGVLHEKSLGKYTWMISSKPSP